MFVRGAPTAARAAPVVRSSLSGEVTALPGHLFLTWPMIPEPPCRMIDNLGTSCEPFVNPKIGLTQGQSAKKAHVHTRRIWFLASSKKPSAEFSSPRRENKLKSVFFGDMCIEKNTSQSASVESGRPLTRLCMQRAATPLKNAGIFEKRVELFRHAETACLEEPGRPPHQTSCWLDSPKLTAMAPSTFFITCSSTRPICSRSRRLSRVRICSNSTMESLGRP